MMSSLHVFQLHFSDFVVTKRDTQANDVKRRLACEQSQTSKPARSLAQERKPPSPLPLGVQTTAVCLPRVIHQSRNFLKNAITPMIWCAMTVHVFTI